MMIPNISLYDTNGATDQINIPSSLPPRKTEINVNLILDSTFSKKIDLQTLISINNNTFYSPPSGGYSGNYSLKLHLGNLNQLQHNNFVNYLNSTASIGINNGYSFNVTAYNNLELNSTFNNKIGISFDAENALQWIKNNLWNKENNVYSLYLFNLTEFDNSGYEHWFTIHPIDPDSNHTVTQFFAGTSGLDNGLQLSSWGGHDPIQFIDFSARNWFGQFINNVWKPQDASIYDTILSKSLSDFGSPVDVTTNAFNVWFNGYIQTFINNIYKDPVMPSSYDINSVNVPILVISNWTRFGYSSNNVTFILNSNIINSELKNSFGWLNFSINAQFNDLSNYPNLITEIKKYLVYVPSEGIYTLDLSQGLYSYLLSSIVPTLPYVIGYDRTFPSIVLLFDNVILTWQGNRIAGISFGNWQIQGITPSRAFTSGTFIRGLSKVITHEIGHSLGLPHPFTNSNGWASDFVASLMGYYSSWPNFSIYDINRLGHVYSDNYLVQAEYVQQNYRATSFKDDNIINTTLDNAIQAQNQWDYNLSIFYAKLALKLFHQNYLGNGFITKSSQSNPVSENISNKNSSKKNLLDYPYISLIILIIFPIFIIYKRKLKN